MAAFRNIFKKAEPKPKLPKMGEVGWAESQLYLGAFPKYNPDDLIGRKGASIYRKMLLDEQVKAVVKFKRDAITSRDYTFMVDEDALGEKEAERRIAMYEKMLDDFKGSWLDGMNFIMAAMYQGFSLTEKIYAPFDYENKPYIGINNLKMKPFDTFSFKVDKHGNIKEVVQELDGQEQKINLEKFVYYLHNPEFDSHYGQSELREAYRSWYSKDVTIRLQNQFLERFAGGFTVAKPSEGTTLTRGTNEYNAVLSAIQNIRTQTSILFPSNMELDVHQPASTDQFEKAIVMHDLQIAKALLVPNLLGITHQGATGSFAQASTQLEAFLWTLDADASRLEDALNEQIFIPLAKVNFADGIGPKLKFKAVSEQKKFENIRVWNELVSGSSVQASDSDEKHLRELLDFPDKGEVLEQPEMAAPLQPEKKKVEKAKEKKKKPTHTDETVMGAPSGIMVGEVAFNRALKRVSFSVMDRKIKKMEAENGVMLEGKISEMLKPMIATIEEQQLGTDAGEISNINKLDFSSKDKTKLRKAINASLQEAWNFGIKHATDEIASAKGEPFKANMRRLQDDAADFLEANGFRMLGNLTADMQKIVLEVLMNGVKFSWTTRDIILRIYDALMVAGFISMSTNSEATGRSYEVIADLLGENLESIAEWLRPDADTILIPPHRVRTAVRTSSMEAINEARYSSFTDPLLNNFIEAMEYSAILDGRTTPLCRHLDRRVYPIDSPVWDQGYKPPNHFNCRSLLIGVSIVDTEISGIDPEGNSRWSNPPDPDMQPAKGFGG